MIYAKMIRMGDYYGIKGLCGYAAMKPVEGLEATLFAKINRDVVYYVIKVTSLATTHNNIRLVIGRSLASDFFLWQPTACNRLARKAQRTRRVRTAWHISRLGQDGRPVV
jgi:hypothetical protein